MSTLDGPISLLADYYGHYSRAVLDRWPLYTPATFIGLDLSASLPHCYSLALARTSSRFRGSRRSLPNC
jgi:hypothetical protein